MRYGPVSYHSLGRVFPRDELRQPFPRRIHRLAVGLVPSAAPVAVPGPFNLMAGQAGYLNFPAGQAGYLNFPAGQAGYLNFPAGQADD